MDHENDGSINVTEWLKENQLMDAEETFKKRQICVEELTEFGSDDLQEFAKEIGLDTLQKNRFVRGILSLKKSMNSNKLNQNPNNNNNGNAVINNNNDYGDATNRMIEQMQKGFTIVDDSVSFCKSEVHKKMNELMELIKQKEQEIIKELQLNSQNKKDEIAKQLQQMIDHRLEMKAMDYATMQKFESMVNASVNYKVKVEYDNIAESNLFKSFKVNSSNIPSECLIVVNDHNISSNSIKINWEIENNSDSLSKITEYEVQYAKYKKMYVSSLKNQKSKNKNKKSKSSKKKRKKKKKRYDDSSSNTSSDSETSDSDTDSDSSNSDSEDDDSNDLDDEKQRQKDIEMENIDLSLLAFKSVKFKNENKIAKRQCFKLKKLNRGYCYVIRMRCKNEFGWSSWSENIRVTTKSQQRWQFEDNANSGFRYNNNNNNGNNGFNFGGYGNNNNSNNNNNSFNSDNWKDFDQKTSRIIQRACDNGKKSVKFTVSRMNYTYRISFRSMQQTNEKTGKVRRVRIAR